MKFCVNFFIFLYLFVQSLVATEKEEHMVLCRNCGRDIADPYFLKVSPLSPFFLERQNVTMFGSQVSIPVEQLRNPAGIEFKVVTFTRAGCTGVGEWTSEASWYPGYLWRGCICPHCRAHIGWMFEPEDTAVEERQKPSGAGFYAIIVNKVIDENFASTLTITQQLKDRGPDH